MPMKFAYLGAWHSHATMHVREAKERPDEVECLGFYDPDPEVVAERKEGWVEYLGDVHAFESAEAVLESGADMIIVEGHVYENLDYAQQTLEAGTHVLLEKPAGANLAHFERLQGVAKEKGLTLNLAYMWRYNPATHEAIRLSQIGKLGQIYGYRGHIPKPKSWHKDLYTEYNAYHGGIYFEMAGHLIDNMVAHMGEPTEVHPFLRCHYGDRKEVDNAVVVHEYEDGLAQIDMGGMQIGSARRIEVHGTEGTALQAPIGGANLSLCFEKPVENYPEGWTELELGTTGSEWSLLREMRACMEGKKEPDYSHEHDLTVQKVLMAGIGVSDGNAMR